jgi:hypothetical protein
MIDNIREASPHINNYRTTAIGNAYKLNMVVV